MPTWQATAVVPFQWHMQAAGGIMPTDGSLPERLEPVSRIPRQSASFGDISIRMRPLGETELPPQPGFEYAAIRLQVDAESAQAALERIHPALELLLDDLAFQLQTTFIVLQLEILDVTEPLAIGDEREMLLYPFPQGYQQWKFARSTAMGTETVAIVPTLRSDYAALPNRHQQALDWYLKGIHAPVDSDRYIYFWVALEVLEKLTPHTVATPYNANCGHTIERCPHCDNPPRVA